MILLLWRLGLLNAYTALCTYLLQDFGLTASIFLPMLSLSDKCCEMGVVHLGKSSSSSFTVCNKSISKAVWTIEPCQGTYSNVLLESIKGAFASEVLLSLQNWLMCLQ